MASHGGEGHVVGYTPAKNNQGWGIALLVCLLTASLWTTAWLIHRTTFEDPTDPMSPGSEAPAAMHGEAPAAAHGEAPTAANAAAPAGH